MALVKDLARQKAAEVLEEHWDSSLPVDPVRIALNVGIKVYDSALPENASGLIIKRAGQPAQILLNQDEPAARKNFTCAHELGHWFERDAQHDDEYSFIDRRDDRPNDAHEWYAEHFAANLLMPAKRFIKEADRGWGVADLARMFAVSPAAVRTRLRHLGLAGG